MLTKNKKEQRKKPKEKTKTYQLLTAKVKKKSAQINKFVALLV